MISCRWSGRVLKTFSLSAGRSDPMVEWLGTFRAEMDALTGLEADLKQGEEDLLW